MWAITGDGLRMIISSELISDKFCLLVNGFEIFSFHSSYLIVMAYMPYFTLWDKISQSLAHLEAFSHKIFQISQNFQTILQHILWRNKHKSHFVVFITNFLHLNKGFWLFCFVKISQNFIKSLLKICLISQISVHGLCHGSNCRVKLSWRP